MPDIAAAVTQALRTEHRRLRHRGAVPRLWGTLRSEWLRLLDRAKAQAWLNHRLRRA
ncbi:MAG TPA: hypothetical protein VME47_11200 [Acetobacteraceae bacterium]|nr:hypothetical protein [Acetobacteraceae bacterium]